MEQRNRIMSIIFPLINILVPAVFLLVNGKEYVSLFPFSIFLGGVVGGVIPLAATLTMKLDTSEGFGLRCLYFVFEAVLCVLSWIFVEEYAPLVVPVIALVVYAYVLKNFCLDIVSDKPTGTAEYLIMLLSNPLMIYIGFLADLLFGLYTNGFHINIPG